MFQFPKRLAFIVVTLALVLLATGAFALRPTQAAPLSTSHHVHLIPHDVTGPDIKFDIVGDNLPAFHTLVLFSDLLPRCDKDNFEGRTVKTDSLGHFAFLGASAVGCATNTRYFVEVRDLSRDDDSFYAILKVNAPIT